MNQSTLTTVRAVHLDGAHAFSKRPTAEIDLVAGLGVRGDAHMGARVQHRSRVAVDPTQPNLRQVHLIQEELFAHAAARGFDVSPGELGENITTSGIDLLDLPLGAVLKLGSEALVVATGLRNPCKQIDHFKDGLLKSVRYQDEAGHIVRLVGIMGVVVAGGIVRPGDEISVSMPPAPLRPLAPV